MEEAEALCPEVALMHQGKILVRGPIGKLLKEHGGKVRVQKPRKYRATLEDLFLNLTGARLKADAQEA